MKYLKKINNEIIYPYNIDNLKKDYPNTSFPENLTEFVLINFNIFSVEQITVPFDYTKNYTEGIPNYIEGKYYQNWIEEDATTEQINERLNGQWNIIRSMRNEYLQQCDWTQLSDSPLSESKKSEWSIYRQALRDVTLQEDPFNIVWPTKPE
jgi:hypothetical protein